MSSQPAYNMLICQSGGPSAVINQSLVAAVLEARKHKQIRKIHGALYGIKGILAEDLIDLGRESVRTLRAVANTPSSGLGSSRKKVSEGDCGNILAVLKKYGVGYLFCIGGNDSAENAHIINEHAKQAGFKLHSFHIPKTIDNDLRENDHTPGFGSAAKFVAYAVMGDNLDNRAMPGVKIDIIMGRNAGFLTAASALGRVYPDDGPHLIYLPERPFSLNRFVNDVKRVYGKLGRCVVAVSEGINDNKGVPIATKFSKEVDSFGNVQLSGSGALGDLLAHTIKRKTKISRVRADTFGYLQRSFPGIVSETDAKEAWAVGVAAVREAVRGRPYGSIVIRRKPGRKYGVYLKCIPLKKVAKETREMPAEFINKAGNDVTEAFINYARPIVGDLHVMGRFKCVKVGK